MTFFFFNVSNALIFFFDMLKKVDTGRRRFELEKVTADRAKSVYNLHDA